MSYFSPCSQTFKWSEGRFTSAAHINVDITEQINSKCFTAKGKSIQTYMYNFHPQLKQEKKTRTEKESAFERGCSCGRSCQAVLVQRKRGTDGTPDISVRTTESSHLTLHTQKKKQNKKRKENCKQLTEFLRTLPFFCLIHITQRPTWAATVTQVSVARQQQQKKWWINMALHPYTQ